MGEELAGGSWSADLSVTTEHLVRNEVHPALSRLGLPAKMLQNAVKAFAAQPTPAQPSPLALPQPP